jgi:hypothetical protein
MTKYLLLRDNKESGPYSFDELKAKGLKAYDLVWIEGKSAAWRYPCEVEELSSFAPAVEEQPFDRFYKRPSQENYSATSTIQRKEVASSIFSGEPSAVPGKRIIYVTLPAGKAVPVNVNKESAPRETVKAPAAIQDRSSSSPNEPVPAGKAYSPVLPEHSPLPAPYPVEDKSSQTPEDWNVGVEIMPRTNKRRNLSKILQPIAVVLCVLALLAAGIFIGLSINKDSPGFMQKIAVKKEPVIPPPPPGHAAGNLPASSAAPALQVQALHRDTTNTASVTATETRGSYPKKPVSIKGKSSLPSQKAPSALPSPVKDSALISLPVVHREASRRTDMPIDKIDKDVIRNNLSNLVSVGTNGYTVGTFGGISGVQLTVSNKSVYPLDLVVVEVQYIQANKKVFKTENLYFRGIAPGSALMQEAPNSSRGVKVQYKITLVNSKELGLSYSVR